MTHDYKAALDAIGCMKLIENRSVKHLKGILYYKHYETIRHALQLAQEAEHIPQITDAKVNGTTVTLTFSEE